MCLASRRRAQNMLLGPPKQCQYFMNHNARHITSMNHNDHVLLLLLLLLLVVGGRFAAPRLA